MTTLNDLLKSPSLTLENKGSVARDHMANERTFLAWLRTSLSFITIGIGVTQLFRLEAKSTSVEVNYGVVLLGDKSTIIAHYGKPLGSVFIVLGILTLLFGCWRFFQVQHALTGGLYPASRLGVLLLIGSVFLVVLVTFVMVVKVV
ncbi:hypothetical protein DIURU_002481 [Diutina rugosa]|uniref:DUF202 domain-containing protein n=1 Tax=Diutina rugosa TaxID=5481 RepID=A0A642UQE8_DIURU|nr:uncharacterized protein DIURU_002481 [Diutina rugosa]KAA8903319.1 hypothetical protein DIURU_002481 [Diutina rugosa]